MKIISCIFVILIVPFYTMAQDENIHLKFSGFADTYHAVRSKSPNDFMSSRSRLRTELSISKKKSYLFASLNSIHNDILEDQTKIELREAFFQYTSNHWDLKLGRQIIIWGVADGMRITDLVSPMDYTEFLARDYDDIRIPVNAIKIKYVKPSFNIEFVFVPVPEFFIMPVDPQNPWSMTYNSSIPIQINMNSSPVNTIKNSELGGRFSFFLSGIDFAFSALHSWNKIPVFENKESLNSDSLFMKAHYDRMDMLGLDFSVPLGKFVIRGELAGYFNELQEVTENKSIKKNTVNYLVGVDCYPGLDWTLTAQLYQKHILKHESMMSLSKTSLMATLSITKKLLRNTLSLSSFSYIDLQDNGFFNRTSADYSLTDQIHIMLGYDWFKADKGMFGIYKDNSEYWLKAKYSF